MPGWTSTPIIFAVALEMLEQHGVGAFGYGWSSGFAVSGAAAGVVVPADEGQPSPSEADCVAGVAALFDQDFRSVVPLLSGQAG